jgi:hypothetical protein
MQLKGPPGAVRLGLMAASCALLGSVPVRADEASPASPASAAVDEAGPWQVEMGVLSYRENEGRVRTVEPVVNLRRDYGDEHILSLGFAYDSLSGGSPNGAIASKTRVQTFATPSGTSLTANSTPQTYVSPSGNVYTSLAKVTLYSVQPGALPLDPNFHDRRIAVDAGWSQPFGGASHVTVGGHLSDELDFSSLGVNGGFSHDFNEKNTTLAFGLNAELDRVKAIGGTPVGGSDYALLLKTGSKSKQVYGGLLGVTQVMSRRWVAQLNYSYDRSQGYLTDPYKVLSVIDSTGNLMAVSSTEAASPYRWESRPERRTRQSLYFGNKVALGQEVLDVSLRRGKDDWGIRSTTLDAKLRLDLGNDWYLEPHVRWYHQDKADFYRLYLNAADPIPTFMSADPRLAKFTATTFGFKVGVDLGENRELSLRIEQYQQKAADRFSSLENLQGLDLNPTLKSAIVQLGWKMEW